MIDYTYTIEVKNSVSFMEWIRHNARPSILFRRREMISQ
ncbi:hypothetical protein UYSO10_4356 [Kosakonia radicincitans]|nr:hypothetical protein UYSO10_4356 [Kosakonia radicincitans]